MSSFFHKSTQLINSKPNSKVIFGLICSILFISFMANIPSWNIGYPDATELITVAKHWGLTKTPGYVWYSGILSFFMNFNLFGGNETFRANLLSALSMVISLYIMATTSLRVISKIFSRSQKNNRSLGIFSVMVALLVIASNQHLYLNSLMANAYIFSLPIISILYYLIVLILFDHRFTSISLLSLGIVTGILITHEPLALTILPIVGYLVYLSYQQQKKLIIPFLIGFITILVTWFAVFYWRNIAASDPSWIYSTDIKSFAHEIFKNYQSIFKSIPPSKTIINSLIKYFTFTFETMYWWPLLPVLFTIYLSRKFNRDQNIVIYSLLLLIGIIWVGLVGWSSEIESQAKIIKIYIPSIILLIPLISIGLNEFIIRLNDALEILGFSKLLKSIICIIIPTITTLITFGITIHQINPKSFVSIRSIYPQLINSLPQSSILTCYTEVSCFSFFYEQTINHVRPDITIVPSMMNYSNHRIKNLMLERFNYPDSSNRFADLISWNLGKTGIYAFDLTSNYISTLGINNGYMYFIPMDLMGEFSRNVPEDLYTSEANTLPQLNYPALTKYDYAGQAVINSYSQQYFVRAYLWLKHGNRTIAQNYLNHGVNQIYHLQSDQKNKALSLRGEIEKTEKDNRFNPGSTVKAVNEIYEHIVELVNQSKFSNAFYYARMASIIDPTHIPSRLELANLYLKQGNNHYATLEFNNILSLDPQNQEAKQNLTKLQ